MTVKYPQASIRLVGEDGNAFSILARTMDALRKAGVAKDEITAYHTEATSGDYGNLLITTMNWVTCDAPSSNTDSYDPDCVVCGFTVDIYSDGMCEDCWDEAEAEDEDEED
jgi:hypothetical protein